MRAELGSASRHRSPGVQVSRPMADPPSLHCTDLGGTQKDHCMDGEWEEREKARGKGVQQNNKGVAWEERGWTHSEC